MSTPETTKPLDDEMLGDLVEEGLGDLIVYIDGKPYCDEDLYQCGGCEFRSDDRYDLDDDLLCEECADETRAEEENLRQLRSDYYASVL